MKKVIKKDELLFINIFNQFFVIIICIDKYEEEEEEDGISDFINPYPRVFSQTNSWLRGVTEMDHRQPYLEFFMLPSTSTPRILRFDLISDLIFDF